MAVALKINVTAIGSTESRQGLRTGQAVDAAPPNKPVNLTGGSRCSPPAGYRQRYAGE